MYQSCCIDAKIEPEGKIILIKIELAEKKSLKIVKRRTKLDRYKNELNF